MRYYETLYIVNPNLENEALDITMGEIGTELEKSKSKIILEVLCCQATSSFRYPLKDFIYPLTDN